MSDPIEIARRELVLQIAEWLDGKARHYAQNKHLGPYSTELADELRATYWKPDSEAKP
jgi:hypothetical protein